MRVIHARYEESELTTWNEEHREPHPLGLAIGTLLRSHGSPRSLALAPDEDPTAPQFDARRIDVGGAYSYDVTVRSPLVGGMQREATMSVSPDGRVVLADVTFTTEAGPGEQAPQVGVVVNGVTGTVNALVTILPAEAWHIQSETAIEERQLVPAQHAASYLS